MAWVILLVSGVFEAVWAAALGRSDGFSRPLPTVIFAIALAISMGGLAVAMRSLPAGTAYAVWVAVGASLVVAFGMVSGTEPVSVVRALLLAGLIGCVVGLKLTD